MKASLQYLADHAKTLRESGAPHQQDMAAHIEAVVDAIDTASGADDRDEQITALNEQITQLKANLGQMIDERDAALDRVKELEAVAGPVNTTDPAADKAYGKKKS